MFKGFLACLMTQFKDMWPSKNWLSEPDERVMKGSITASGQQGGMAES